MAATYGTLYIADSASPRVYAVECYLPDAVAGLWGFNLNGKAASTSRTTLSIPCNGRILAFKHTTSPTATGATISLDSQVVNGGTLRYDVNITGSAVGTCPMNIPVRMGQLLSVVNF